MWNAAVIKEFYIKMGIYDCSYIIMLYSLLWRSIVLRRSVFIEATMECYIPLELVQRGDSKKCRSVRL